MSGGPKSEGAVPGAALDGVRILDLTWGTEALGVLLLAEQGADTI